MCVLQSESLVATARFGVDDRPTNLAARDLDLLSRRVEVTFVIPPMRPRPGAQCLAARTAVGRRALQAI